MEGRQPGPHPRPEVRMRARMPMLRQLAAWALGGTWLGLLAVVNAAGTAYGIWWYRAQLGVTPWPRWPLVADSPTSVLLMTLLLICLRAGHRWPSWAAWPLLACAKYGLWTVAVIGEQFPRWVLEDWLLVLSHAGMVAEAVLYAALVPLEARGLAVGFAWLLANDFLDWTRGWHPYLPAGLDPSRAAAWGVATTWVALGMVWGASLLRRRGLPPEPAGRAPLEGG